MTNAIKSKFVYKGGGIAFDGESLCSYDNELARNSVIFVVDNTSSSHTGNPKNNFLLLGEGLIDGINDSIDAAEWKFSINFSTAKTKRIWISIATLLIVYVNKKEI